MRIRSLAAAGGIFLLPAATLFAQPASSLVAVTPASATARSAVTVTAELRQGHRVRNVLLLYRSFGTGEYRKAEMDLRGNTAQFTLPADRIAPPFVEYYLVLVNSDGTQESSPGNAGGDPFTSPPAQPLRISVLEVEEQQVIFLSPDPGSTVDADDVLISFSLLRADSAVARRGTQIKLDDITVTQNAVFSGDLVVYAPENTGVRLSPGIHTVKVGLFNRKGQFVSSSELSFSIRRPGMEGVTFAAAPSRFNYNAGVQVESRHETVGETGEWYNRAGVQFRGTTDIWTFSSNVFLTSDEKSNRQPQNRFYAGVETPWVKVGYGDHYPVFPDLILNGKRVRGLQATVRYGILGVDLTLGEITRPVDGTLLKSFPADSFSVEFRRDSTAAFGPITSSTWGKFDYGTFARKLFAVRPSIGNRETWEVGFSWLSSGDDMGSILHGIKPQENILVGSDFMAKFDKGRIEMSGQGAFSAFNTDISSGTFSDAKIDSLGLTGAEGIKRVRDVLKDYITVNDNFRPLSVKELSTLAYELGLGLNYFENAFKFTYLYRGSDYTSFGQSFIQNDIRGFKMTDRARVVDNHLFLTLGFERLEDNTGRTKAATTVFSNLNVAATYFPRHQVPTVTLGFSRYGNTNEQDVNGRDSLTAIKDATNRVYLQSSYDFRAAVQHTATLSFSYSQRSDETLRRLDVRNVTAEAGLTTNYRIPLRTLLSVAFSMNSLPTGTGRGESHDLNYTAISLHGRYALLREVLTLTATIAPTLGDYKRTAFDIGGEWAARPDMSVLLQLAYFHNDDSTNDSIVSLRYRFNI